MKLTPEMEASIAATSARLDAEMQDPAFRAEVAAIENDCAAKEYADSLMRDPWFVRASEAFRERFHRTLRFSFGESLSPDAALA